MSEQKNEQRGGLAPAPKAKKAALRENVLAKPRKIHAADPRVSRETWQVSASICHSGGQSGDYRGAHARFAHAPIHIPPREHDQTGSCGMLHGCFT